MRKFIIRTFLFILPVLAIAVSAEILLRKIPNDYSYKSKYLDQHAGEIETLILGSSHTYRGINPDYISGKAFNASYVSQSLNYDYEILKKYQNKLSNLKTIVLPISYFTLFSKIELGLESWRVKNYHIYYHIHNGGLVSDYFEVLSNKPKVNLKRIYGYYFKHKVTVTCSTLGWGKIYKSKKSRDLAETGITAAKRHTRGDIHSEDQQQLLKENMLILNTMIKWCKNKNVKILLFTPPAFISYRQNINSEQYNFTVNTVKNLALQYDNLRYINLFDDPEFVSTDFYNADHLNPAGAEKLSKLINQKLKEW